LCSVEGGGCDGGVEEREVEEAPDVAVGDAFDGIVTLTDSKS
jgi:hypothetical protein